KRRHAELALGLIDVALSALCHKNRSNVLYEAEVLRGQRAAGGRSRISLGFLSCRIGFLPLFRRRRESGNEANDNCADHKMHPAMNTTISKISLLHARGAPQNEWWLGLPPI